MHHRLSPEAEAELDGIWYYIAKESGSMDIADRFLDALTDRFCLPGIHISVAAATETCVPACVAFPSVSI